MRRDTNIAAESVIIGMVITDERFRYHMQVGHIAIGPKWVNFRSFHPQAHVYPNTPYRVRRGGTVTVHLELTDVAPTPKKGD